MVVVFFLFSMIFFCLSIQDLLVIIIAILNDTTGTLMSCAWVEPLCHVGTIVGEFEFETRNSGGIK